MVNILPAAPLGTTDQMSPDRAAVPLLNSVRDAADTGVAVLLVEQHTAEVLSVADRAVLMGRGQIQLSADRSAFGSSIEELEASYLGVGG